MNAILLKVTNIISAAKCEDGGYLEVEFQHDCSYKPMFTPNVNYPRLKTWACELS